MRADPAAVRNNRGTHSVPYGMWMSLDLRTMHCTQCDYSLEGLPRNAKCPECGTAIDDRFLVLRGYGAGAQANAFTAHPRRVPLVMLGAGSGLFIQFIVNLLSGGFRSRSSLGVVAVMVLIGGGLVILRRTNLGGMPVQLWLCREGFWFRNRLSVFQSRAWGWLGGSIACVVCAALVIYLFTVTVIGGVIVASIFAWLALIVIWTLQASRRDTIAVEVDGLGTIRFARWSSAERAVISAKPDGWATLRIDAKRASFWTLQSQASTSILYEPSVGDAGRVERHVLELIHPARRPVARSRDPGSTMAGGGGV